MRRSAPFTMTSEPQEIGKYRIIRRLAKGGMGAIYLASPGPGAAPVVLKTLSPDAAKQPAMLEMFREESWLSSLLDHPNIVRGLEVGSGEPPFLALEYLQGLTVAELMRRSLWSGQPLGAGFAAAVGAQVCAGLAYAHAMRDSAGLPLNLVHRDISPQNLLVTRGGEVKILDFGIAKFWGKQAHTVAGNPKGKLRYMSPEQALGTAVDGRSDLFALGTVLWECLAGRPMRTGTKPMEVLREVTLLQPPPIASLTPGVPSSLAAAVDQALSLEPGKRFADAGAMRQALDAALRELGLADPRAVLGSSVAEREGAAALESWLGARDAGADPEPPSAASPEAPARPQTRARFEGIAAPGGALPTGAFPPSATAPPAGQPQQRRRSGTAMSAETEASRSRRALLLGTLAVVAAAGAVAVWSLRTPRQEPVARAGSFADLAMVKAAISSEPAGARIAVDGADSGLVTPAELTLQTGRDHLIALSYPESLPASEKVFAAPNNPLTVKLKLIPGARVAVDSKPAGAQVELDGKPAFRTPGKSVALPVGKHTLVIRLDGFVVQRRQLDLAEPKEYPLEVALTPGVPLAIDSDPAGAEIDLDDVAQGVTTPGIIYLSPLELHRLRLYKEGYLPKSEKMIVAESGRTRPVHFRLVNAKELDLRTRLSSSKKKLSGLEARLAKLRSQESGMVVHRSAAQELKLTRAIEDAEREAEEVSNTVADLEDELNRLASP